MSKRLPKILIDARMIPESGMHGIARYVALLAEGIRLGLSPLVNDFDFTFLVHKQQRNALSYLAGNSLLKTKYRWLSFSEILGLSSEFEAHDFDLYHSTSFSSPLFQGPHNGSLRTISTVHDLNHLYYGNLFQKLYYGIFLKLFLKKASSVITVSEFSKHELVENKYSDPSKITVIPNALSYSWKSDSTQNRSSRGIAIFSDKKHKNFEFIKKLLEHLDIEVIGSREPLNEDEWKDKLNNAAFFLYPSLYEGFGFPIIEAVRLGTPVFASKIPPHIEIAEKLKSPNLNLIENFDVSTWISVIAENLEFQRKSPFVFDLSAFDIYSLSNFTHAHLTVYARVLAERKQNE